MLVHDVIYFLPFWLLFFLNILHLYCPSGISPMGNSGCFPRGEPSATESRYRSTVHAGCFSVSIIYHTLTWTTGSSTCPHNDVNACDCARGCTDTVRESAPKVDHRSKIPCRAGEPNLRERRAGPMLYQLSFIPVRRIHRMPDTK